MANMTPRVIVALDVPTMAEALALVGRLGDACDFVKVGSELFTAAGPAVVEALRARGLDIFLDLKFHDIPNTVRSASRRAAALGARLITVHASGGRAMLEAAVEGAREGSRHAGSAGCGVLAVTVLTSLDAPALGESWGREIGDVEAEVLRLADLARSSGVQGIVCSGAEAAAVHTRHGSALDLLVPGIRLSGGAVHDQKRVVTPAEALAAGATYLILGRAVTGVEDGGRMLGEVRRAVASRE
jgi:orotidine-5'-phosphate decarboxylase